ncbi:MAG: hypothetical protein R6V50_01075 [Thermoplasmatota archaeon]
MNTKLILLTLGIWFFFMVLAIINAGMREGIFSLYLNSLRSHQLSTITLMILIFVVTYLLFRFRVLELSDKQALFMGFFWLILSISFEFLAGHYIFGNSWENLFGDYNIFRGRIWILILITLFISPYLAKKLI